MHDVLNWLWQGCAVALALFAMLGLLERARANVRYIVCWAAQVLVLSLPLVAMLESGGGAPGRLPRVPVDAVVSVPDAWWTSGLVIAAAWFAWTGVGAVRFVRAILALRRARASSRPFPPQAESPLTHWRQVRDRARRPRLVVSDSVTAAAVLGCGVPMIAVAPALATRLEADELDRVLVHEWAHVQRRDDLVNLLQIAIRIVAGWHPAVWWIDRRLQAEREIACDETTVAITGAPKSYAACLVKLAGLKGAATAPLAAPGVLAARGLRARITRIVSHGAFLAPGWSFSCAAAIAAVLAVVSVAVAQTKLVEPTVFELPYESIRMAGARLESLAPVAVPVALSRDEPEPTLRQPPAHAPARPSTGVDLVAVQFAAQEAGPQSQPAPPASAPAAEPQAAEAQNDRVVETEQPVAPSPAPPARSTVTGDRERSPWAQAADGGTALGKISKDAGLATAGFFSKFGRRVAGSF
jgi:beta-lactamase regulating signal transducer with metallopeptidase domain